MCRPPWLRRRPPDEFDDEGGHWISASVAARRHGFSRPILYRWHNVGCSWLGGRKLRVRKRRVAGSGTKRLYERWFFNSDELAAVTRSRAAGGEALAPEQWLTGRQAYEEFRLSKTFLLSCRRSRCCCRT